VYVLAALAVATFAALAIWLANAAPAQVTHAEAMQMAAAIEQASTLAELDPLFDHVETIPDPECRITKAIAAAKQTPHEYGSGYTFIEVRLDDQDQRSLLFRVHTGDLLEYHELRLERRGRAVRVTDAWSAMFDAWLSDLRRQLDRSERAQALAFLQRLAAKDDPEQLTEAWRALPPAVRSAGNVAMPWFYYARMKGLPAQPGMLAAFAAERPGHLGPPLLRLIAPETPRDERLAAVDKIAARVPDAKFLDRMREQIAR
jgi:hypothetical protein